jgi:dihydroneopterin aldolase/2-amino-4-hydroxy-6-hydroxymethyldihydropteridine diphosphokinase
MMDQITIYNLEVFCNHGVYKEENKLGQRFLVTANLFFNISEASRQDDITKSINYGDVCKYIVNFMKNKTYKLIETVAEHLAQELLLNIQYLQSIKVEISKPWAPIGLHLDNVSVTITRKWHQAYIALGSNIGDREKYLLGAVNKIKNNNYCKVTNVSDFITTKPYGFEAQDDFLNGCLEMKTILQPKELLALMNQIEDEAGRERKIHWGPRTLDLDIIFYDDLIIMEDNLFIPHKEMHKRKFVLQPLAQIAPYAMHPVYNKYVIQMLDECSEEKQ